MEIHSMGKCLRKLSYFYFLHPPTRTDRWTLDYLLELSDDIKQNEKEEKLLVSISSSFA